MGEAQGQHAALVEVQLVLVGLGDVEDLHVAVLHAHRQPLPRGTVAQGEDLQPHGAQLSLCVCVGFNGMLFVLSVLSSK